MLGVSLSQEQEHTFSSQTSHDAQENTLPGIFSNQKSVLQPIRDPTDPESTDFKKISQLKPDKLYISFMLGSRKIHTINTI
jgi:hypothetical protein